MEECRDATIEGSTPTWREVRSFAAKKKLSTTASLTVFNGDVEMPRFMESLDVLTPLNHASYEPDGSTALLDAGPATPLPV